MEEKKREPKPKPEEREGKGETNEMEIIAQFPGALKDLQGLKRIKRR